MLSLPLYFQTIIAMAFGVAAGLIFGHQTSFLGFASKWFIEIIKAIAIPLIFFAILDAVLKKEFKGKGVLWLFIICAINSFCAIAIALFLANLKDLGSALPLHSSLANKLLPHTTGKEIFATLMLSPMTLAIITSLTLGGILSCFENKFFHPIQKIAHTLFSFTLKIIKWAVSLSPLAVFAAVAKVVGENGFSMIQGLNAYFTLCVAGMIFQSVLVYLTWIVAVVRMPLKNFWKEARGPMVYSFGINSSLATVPLTLSALQRLNVTPGSARLSACVGTNFNNDGILVFVISGTLFMAQAYGIHFTFPQQVLIALSCVPATIVVGGIPEAGIIALSLILTAAKLPIEGIPILLTVDWFLGRCRSVVNVTGDLVVALAIDALGPHKGAQRCGFTLRK